MEELKTFNIMTPAALNDGFTLSGSPEHILFTNTDTYSMYCRHFYLSSSEWDLLFPLF